ncbi:polysaccharide biosynthesis tyrosine autokinase [Cellulomonas dongxiuzhuiae]|uniref:Polysaccharide biosynthesis tyrosine autokinase n=1 Tax=Cellulomonas dongxiuzhuiae TaxID=2819979 RepID=A0ABX8GMF8_9CELL|nr:polysaccharide biosynthesis tyrosine autokinase [Cellulomonas dongxiuzhuiae]MBO3096486.1 polysaccharide biosynthesis tyrosine autokinase [Cellulomonas dongxiuzhuiae]QWC16882.1 polysaccharide biosynthesis tyrosine autokinase [Cellulomonas dongxiuzhuiae]
MELDEYLLALRKRWLVIAVLAVVGGALAWAYAQSITPAYRASASVFASVTEAESAGELVQGSTFVQNSVTSFGRLASMPAVLDPVIAELDLDTTAKELSKRVTADNPLNTVILEISTTGPDPQAAATISNAVARQLAVTVQGLSPRTQAGESAIQLSLVAPAVAPAVPFEPNTRFLTASGIAAGALLGVALALLLTLLDTRLRTRADVEKVSGLPVLGTIVRTRSARAAYTTVRTEPGTPRAEAFRRLQVNLQYLETGRRLRTIVVTSAMAREGKTSTSVNLASAVAEKGARVLLVDGDLRMPAIAEALGLEGGAGLTTVLIGRARLDDVVQTWGMPNLHVLTAGDRPPNPSQLLDSPAMHTLLEEAAREYDLVVIDAAPVLPVVDATLLGRRSDGVLLVTRLRSTRRQQLRSALAALERVGATCLGLVATNWTDDGTGATYGNAFPLAPAHRRGMRRGSAVRRRSAAQAAPGAAADDPALADPAAAGRAATGPATATTAGEAGERTSDVGAEPPGPTGEDMPSRASETPPSDAASGPHAAAVHDGAPVDRPAEIAEHDSPASDAAEHAPAGATEAPHGPRGPDVRPEATDEATAVRASGAR